MPDLRRGYWTPLLPARGAFDLERGQIENGLYLESFVSLTDHDNVDAPCCFAWFRRCATSRSPLNGRCLTGLPRSTSASTICQRRAPTPSWPNCRPTRRVLDQPTSESYWLSCTQTPMFWSFSTIHFGISPKSAKSGIARSLVRFCSATENSFTPWRF